MNAGGTWFTFVPPGPVEAKLPPTIRGILEKVKKANGNFKLLHFTLQFGRLKIEFSQAKGTAETTRTGGIIHD